MTNVIEKMTNNDKLREIEIEENSDAAKEQIQSLKREIASLRKAASQSETAYLRHIDELNTSLIGLQKYSAFVAMATSNKSKFDNFAGETIGDYAWYVSILLRFGLRIGFNKIFAYRMFLRNRFFDSGFYREAAGLEFNDSKLLLRNYIQEGYQKKLSPSASFSVQKYLSLHKDVENARIEPLTHYEKHGRKEGRMVYGDNIGFGSIASEVIMGSEEEIEERSVQQWIAKTAPKEFENIKDPYDYRPDDAVPLEAITGNSFINRFNLTGNHPEFKEAVEYLNALINPCVIAKNSSDNVKATIVVPIYGQLAYTLNCLDSLLKHKSKYNFEIIIGDDRSPDESGTYLPQINSINYILHPKNGGFVLNCNESAKNARGEYVIMLNNDTRVVEGWLDSLIDSFKIYPRAGLVGSKMLYPDGTLQEAGGIVWRDGSAWNYGRNDDPNRPRYCFARRVDYISGCSIAIPTKLWKNIGGFDELYIPAYCEDVDLAFKIRDRGFETWFQPQSRIIHYEGKTSGTDTSKGVKAYQVTNTKKLYERWKSVLADHRENADEPWREFNRSKAKTVMVIDACNPTPNQDAGSLAAVNLCKFYAELNYQVIFVPQDNYLYERGPVSYLQSIGIECLYAPYELGMEKILERYGPILDVVNIHRPSVAIATVDLVRKYVPKAQILFLNADLHYLRMERQAKVEKNKALLKEAAKMRKLEFEVINKVDVTLVHSPHEKEEILKSAPDAIVEILPLIEQSHKKAFLSEDRKDFIFLGGYQHTPNVDTANWIIDEIWPELSKKFPDSKLLIVGAKPPAELIAKANDRIIVTGMVEDLEPWFARAKVFIAALRYGAGVKGKVLYSLATGVPVVGTDIAAEGFAEEIGKSLFIANTANEIIAKCAEVYELDANSWLETSQEAQRFISKYHSFETGKRVIQSALNPAD